jgi:hypothetical protein
VSNVDTPIESSTVVAFEVNI